MLTVQVPHQCRSRLQRAMWTTQRRVQRTTQRRTMQMKAGQHRLIPQQKICTSGLRKLFLIGRVMKNFWRVEKPGSFVTLPMMFRFSQKLAGIYKRQTYLDQYEDLIYSGSGTKVVLTGRPGIEKTMFAIYVAFLSATNECECCFLPYPQISWS